MNPPPALAQPAKSGSKKWIFLGCGGCLGLIVLVCIGVAVMVFGVFKVIKSSDAYQTALAGAVNSPEVQDALGTPITDSMFVTGSVNITNDTGNANLTIPITGPKGAGAISYVALRTNGVWQASVHSALIPATAQTINLLGKPSAAIPSQEGAALPKNSALTPESLRDAADAIKKAVGDPKPDEK